MFWRDDIQPDETQRLARALIEQGESELVSARDALVEREQTITKLLSGRFSKTDPHWMSVQAVKHDLSAHGDTFSWFVRSETFPRLCDVIEEDPEEIRQQLRTLLYLPWSARLLRKAITDYEAKRQEANTSEQVTQQTILEYVEGLLELGAKPADLTFRFLSKISGIPSSTIQKAFGTRSVLIEKVQRGS